MFPLKANKSLKQKSDMDLKISVTGTFYGSNPDDTHPMASTYVCRSIANIPVIMQLLDYDAIGKNLNIEVSGTFGGKDIHQTFDDIASLKFFLNNNVLNEQEDSSCGYGFK